MHSIALNYKTRNKQITIKHDLIPQIPYRVNIRLTFRTHSKKYIYMYVCVCKR